MNEQVVRWINRQLMDKYIFRQMNRQLDGLIDSQMDRYIVR